MYLKIYLLVVIINLIFHIIAGNTHAYESEYGNKDIPASKIISSCRAFMDSFSIAAANFTSCAVQFARPIKICEHCYESYGTAIDIYSTMMKGDVVNIEGIPCGEKILNADRIQIVVSTAKFIENMWEKSNCDNCFASLADGSRSNQLSNNSLLFKSLAHQTFDCFQNHTSVDLRVFVPTHALPNSTVCPDCHAIYTSLNEQYEKLEQIYNKRICMDLVDSMNYTRMLWSRNLGCSLRQTGEAGIIAVSVLLSSIPVLFYVLHRLLCSGRRMTLLKQKRLNETASDLLDADETILPNTEEHNSRLSSQSL